MHCVALTISVFNFFFFKQKTAYEMRISDWSSDVCSSDLPRTRGGLSDPVGASPLKWQGIWLHRNAGRCPQPLAKRGKVRRVDIYYSRVATKLPPPRGNPGNQRLDGDSTPFHLDT